MKFRCVCCGRWYGERVSWCTGCLAAGSLVHVGWRSPAAVDGEPEVTDARALARTQWGRVAVPAYPDLHLGHGALLLVTGDAGHGKSSMATRLLDSLDGVVVYASVEEQPGPALASRLLRCGVKRDGFVIVGRTSIDQLVALCRARRPVALCIDSVQPALFEAGDLRHLLVVLPTLSLLVGVAQVNSMGVVAGKNALLHEADAVVEVESMVWRLSKSRYQPAGASGHVLPPPAIEERVA